MAYFTNICSCKGKLQSREDFYNAQVHKVLCTTHFSYGLTPIKKKIKKNSIRINILMYFFFYFLFHFFSLTQNGNECSGDVYPI